MGGGSAPKAPTYVPPAAYTSPGPFISPGQFVQPPDPQVVIPQVMTPDQIISQGNQVEGLGSGSQIPQWLQIGQNPMNPAGQQQYQNYFYQTQIAPQLAQAQTQLQASGQGNSSYGGALLGQLQAQGGLSQYQAGLDYAQQLFNNQLQGRQSYFSGGPALAQQQNVADVQRGVNVFQGQQGNAQMQNSYNLDNANMNNNYNLNSAGMQNNYNMNSAQLQDNFNVDNYSNQLKAYQAQQQQQANVFGSLTGGLTKLATGLAGGGGGGGSLLSGLGNMFGGGSLSSPVNSYFSPSSNLGSYNMFGNNASQFGGGGTPGALSFQ